MSKKFVSASHILDLLAGKWFLTRKLTNNINQDFSGSASGKTELLECNQGALSYNESVIVYFDNGVEANGTASYKFRIEEDKLHQYSVTRTKVDTIEDHMFELNFFTTKSNQTYASATYFCSSDKYIVTYSFSSEDRFNITYTVLGPNKDYVTETEFERMPIEKI